MQRYEASEFAPNHVRHGQALRIEKSHCKIQAKKYLKCIMNYSKRSNETPVHYKKSNSTNRKEKPLVNRKLLQSISFTLANCYGVSSDVLYEVTSVIKRSARIEKFGAGFLSLDLSGGAATAFLGCRPIRLRLIRKK